MNWPFRAPLVLGIIFTKVLLEVFRPKAVTAGSSCPTTR